MSTSGFLRSSSAAVLAMGVLSSVGQAQVLTADTIISTTGGGTWAASNAYTQTFSGADSLGLITFRFVAFTVGLGAVSAGLVDYTITNWSGSNAVAGPIISAGSFALDAGGVWTDGGNGFFSYFDSTVDMSSVTSLSALNTYGITLYGSGYTATAGFVLGSLPIDTLYTGGSGFSHGSVSGAGDLIAGGAGPANDFSFSATSAAPVPEASTAAVLFAGVFVGGLMVRRRRRQPVDAVAALPSTHA